MNKIYMVIDARTNVSLAHFYIKNHAKEYKIEYEDKFDIKCNLIENVVYGDIHDALDNIR